MKALFYFTLVLLGISRNVCADGTVRLQNFLPDPWQGGFVWFNPTGGAGTNGGFLAPAGYHIELLYGPIGSTSLSNSAEVFNNTTYGGGQFFDITVPVLAGIPGGGGSHDPTNNVALQIRGWVGPYADYDSALAAGAPIGETAIFSNPTGGGGTPPTPPAVLVGWLADNPLVIPAPEPSTFALGGLGIAGSMLLRQRKRCSANRQGAGVMKNWLLSILLFLDVSGNVHAQGTISFQNFNQVTGRVYVNGVLASSGYHVELLYGPLGSSTNSFLPNSAVVFNVTTGSSGQFFDGTTVILSGIPAGTGSADTNNVLLQIRGWTGPSADWNSAVNGGGAYGVTGVFANPTGGAGTALPANMVGWLANNPLLIPEPEPSTIAVGVLGSGVMLWLNRKRTSGKS